MGKSARSRQNAIKRMTRCRSIRHLVEKDQIFDSLGEKDEAETRLVNEA